MHAQLKLAVLLAGALSAATVLAAAGPGPTKREAESLQRKIAAIKDLAEKPPATSRRTPRRTVITENEVNAYFLFDAARDLPAGVVNPVIAVPGSGQISARAVVDLDAVRKASPPKSLLDPKNLLIGRLPLSAIGTLTTSQGMGTFVLQSASVGNIPLPKLLLQEIVSYYTRSAEKPGGIDIDDPFVLPAGIREIQITRGQAVVIQ